MKVPSREELAQSGTLEELYGKLGQIGIAPGWNKKVASLWPEPKKNFAPAHWKYEQARGALDAAGRLINTELAERRNLILYNPVSDASYGTVRTMVAAYQMIMPGEWARSHRHTPNALRLILDSEAGTYTEVDGVKIAMEPGDVLLTPNWSSHGHGNDSRACAYWLDFLDVPLVQLLEPMFFEPNEEEGESHAPSNSTPPTKDSPFVFPLSETLKRLDAATPTPSGRFGTEIELGNPAMDTIGLHMMRLAPKVKTAPYRTTANNMYAAVKGSGATTVDGERFEWRRGDVIAAPAWRPHFHEAAEDALLLRVTDEPVMQRLGFYRVEEPKEGRALASHHERRHRTNGTPQGRRTPRHRPRQLQRRRQSAGPGLRRRGALAACARADPRNRRRCEARAMPGVLAVLTGQDALADGLTRIPHLAAAGTPPDIVLTNRDGSPVPVAPHHVLATDRVRHVGAAVAFVIAETVAQAKDAAEQVVVDYEPLPAVTDATAAVEKDAPRLYDDLPNIMIDAEVGDAKATDAAFARAAHVTRLDTWVNRVTGVPMEPRAAVGVYDPATGTLHALRRLRRHRAPEEGDCGDLERAVRIRCASSLTRSAAISARATASFPNSRWWSGARARSGGR